jgi:murein DD-endopeptidase MepM/ murein hydrolase activator NlpD
MPEPRRFNLLIVRGDGSRVLRLSVSLWTVGAALASVVLSLGIAAAALTFYGDYQALRRQDQTVASLLPRLARQQALIDLYQQRIREVRTEIDSWRELHAKIWAPFGPEVGPGTRSAGIGGGAATGFFETVPGRGGIQEELTRLTLAVQEEGDNLRWLERFLGRAGKVLASLPSRWPLRGAVNSDFGPRLSPWTSRSEFHGGMDIAAAVGTPVHAPAPGQVVFAGRQSEYGITVIIEHANDTRSIYGHLSRVNVRADQRVERGQVIAWSGSTGRSSGPHLHYEIQVKGRPVNPHSYLWE